MQARLASEATNRMGNARGQYQETEKPDRSYPKINPALLLPRLSEECKAQIQSHRKAIPLFDAKQWAMIERFLVEKGIPPSFTGELTTASIEESYENLLKYIDVESSEDLGELAFETTFAHAPYDANIEIKLERYGFAFMDLSVLHERLGKTFIQALSLIDIVLHDILPSDFYCEHSGHFWPLSECSEEALAGGMDEIMQEVTELAEGEFEDECIKEMLERMKLIEQRGKALMENWCSVKTVFSVIEEVEAACAIESDCDVTKWCLIVTKAIRDAFGSSRNWESWYNIKPDAYNDGFEPIVALHDDWEEERDSFQMAFESDETGKTYTIDNVQDIESIKRVCELRTLGAQLLDKAVALSNQLQG